MHSGSDASSICASSGSPPGSNAAADDIQDWAHEVAENRSASGVLVSDFDARDIKIDSYTLSFHDQLLINDAKIALKCGERYGLLGENGSGKSTFFQSIAARDIEIPSHIDISLVSDGVEPSEMNPVDFLVASAKLKVEHLEAYIEHLRVSCDVDEFPLKFAAYKALGEMQPAPFKIRAGSILRGLGFTPKMLETPIRDMTKAWRVRVALARALSVKPHLLLLKEPTNYLDPGAVVWLEAHLNMYDHILVITSHSQDFLDSVCTNIIHLTNKKMKFYTGNYSTHVRTKLENEMNRIEAYQKQRDEIQRLKEFMPGGQARKIQKILDKMKPVDEEQERQLYLNFGDMGNLNLPLAPVIEFDQIAFSYSGDKNDYLYEDLSFGINMGARIAILGAMGTGKSTLLQLITGALQPSAGDIFKHSEVKVVTYSSHSADQLPDDISPVEYFRLRFPEINPWDCRLRLGRFGLSAMYWAQSIKQLSKGLRNRVALTQLAMEHPHILLFDEPTNHLDMESIEALVHAIKEFKGGVVIVSNDFRLISLVAEELWEIVDRKIKNLTEAGISIVDYENNLRTSALAVILKRARSNRGWNT
ncbi:P-loop containing nucleoside triphosphate hydrolase protein [Mycena latifolia]|nr:P-loop containing nucleoside triphosphate hydrolase protein [Mycena latifolia]